jgi:hypothetical protein
MKKQIKKSILFIVVVFFLFSSAIQAQQKELSVLFVGNSYTYNSNLPHIVSLLSEGTDTKLITQRSVAGGAYLWEHWAGKRGLKTRELIETGNFDVVVLQDNSMATLSVPDSTMNCIKRFTKFNEKHGAKTILFNTWAREKVPQFQEEIDAIYTRGAQESGAGRVPVGEAWQLAIDIRPSVDLYNSDGSHPSQLGTILIASMFVKAITGELPEKYPVEYKIKDEFGEDVNLLWVDPLDSEFCKRIVEEIYE